MSCNTEIHMTEIPRMPKIHLMREQQTQSNVNIIFSNQGGLYLCLIDVYCRL